MSNSNILKEKGANMITKKSVELTVKLNRQLYDIVEEICDKLNNELLNDKPHLVLEHYKKLTNKDAYDILIKLGVSHERISGFARYSEYGVEPDGGIIVLNHLDKDFKIIKTDIVFVSEIKKQGTNDEVYKIDGKKQAIGNAIERLGKNVNFIDACLPFENIYPFLTFVFGCDTEEDYFKSKLVGISKGRDIDTYNLYKIDNVSAATFIFKTEPFTYDEFYDNSYKIAKESLMYYLNKD